MEANQVETYLSYNEHPVNPFCGQTANASLNNIENT